MRKKYIFLILPLLFFNAIFAQVAEVESDHQEEEPQEEFNFKKSIYLGTNFQLGIPQGRFGNNINYTGWGFGGNVMWKFKKNEQFYGGVDFSYQSYDFQSVTDFTFDQEEYETRTKNSIVLGHFQLRFYPKVDFFIQPYVEGLFGAKSLITRTTLTDRTDGANETINSQFENSDFAISFGGAVGFEIPISKKHLFLDVRCAYLKGMSAEYYARKKGDPIYIDPIDVFELKNSVTDLLIPQIGVKFLIGFGNQNQEEYYEEEEYYDD